MKIIEKIVNAPATFIVSPILMFIACLIHFGFGIILVIGAIVVFGLAHQNGLFE